LKHCVRRRRLGPSHAPDVSRAKLAPFSIEPETNVSNIAAHRRTGNNKHSGDHQPPGSVVGYFEISSVNIRQAEVIREGSWLPSRRVNTSCCDT
jgi:hypothetical protein